MKTIKCTIDPYNLFNPGKVCRGGSACHWLLLIIPEAVPRLPPRRQRAVRSVGQRSTLRIVRRLKWLMGFRLTAFLSTVAVEYYTCSLSLPFWVARQRRVRIQDLIMIRANQISAHCSLPAIVFAFTPTPPVVPPATEQPFVTLYNNKRYSIRGQLPNARTKLHDSKSNP